MKNFFKIFVLLFVITIISDAQVTEDTVVVKTGWNLIGSLSNGIPSTILRTDPIGIVILPYYGYNAGTGYQDVTSLEKGKGYWVKASQNGLLFFGSIPLAPILTSPTNGATNQSTSPTFNWDASGGATSYTLQVSTSSSFTNYVYNQSGLTSTSQQVSGLDNSTTYHWRVNATNNYGNSNWSNVWNFTTIGTSGTPCPGIPTVTYSGKTYNTVQIGTQCWLKENLDVGTMISGSQDATNNGVIEKYCYNNNTANCNTYGGLYQWNEAMQYNTTPGTKGICPSGWHIPTYAEFQTLSATVGGNGNALKAIGQGIGGGAGTNTSGFSALLSGYRAGNGPFSDLGAATIIWSSTEYDAADANGLTLLDFNSNIYFVSHVKGSGISVRCLKD